MELFADYHTHTVHSHGQGTIWQNVQAARQQGLRQVAIADHGPSKPWIGVKNSGVLLDIKQYCNALNEQWKDIQVLAGVEANVIGRDGSLDVPNTVIHQLDILLVGLHRWVKPADSKSAVDMYLYNPLSTLRLGRTVSRRAQSGNTKALVEAVYRHKVDIVTHPGFRMSVDMDELARACAKRGTALEINLSHSIPMTDYMQVARKHQVTFCINSDAHRPSSVGKLAAGIEIAHKIGLTAKQIRNAEKEGIVRSYQK